MGAMSIVAQQPDEGMVDVNESSEQTWLEVVKAAAYLEGRDFASPDYTHYPSVVEQPWIQNIKDPKDFRKIKGYHVASDLLQEEEHGLNEGKKASRLLVEEERELVRDLLQKLALNGGLTEENFIGLLGPYLQSLKQRTAEGYDENDTVEPHSNGAVMLQAGGQRCPC